MGSGIDRGGSGDRAPLPSPQSTRCVSAPGRHQCRARGRCDNRADRLVAIVVLYDQLLAVTPTPVVALNRAIAIGEMQGAAAALALVDGLDLDNYHPFHAT
jgi:predicted RNA polymerase sigma factor